MNKIEVKVIDVAGDPGRMAGFLARLTQRGHAIKSMDDLEALMDKPVSSDFIKAISSLPHGTIKRFTPITIAIVGASRRFLAQARTSQVGTNFVSASLQYSNYDGNADFVVPYALKELDAKERIKRPNIGTPYEDQYLDACRYGMGHYSFFADAADNDTAGYVAPQGLRNILIMQANHQAWDYWIRLRGCNRNTVETQYVTMLMWEELLKTPYGEEFFGNCGPDCITGACREGKMTCGNPMKRLAREAKALGISVPRHIINTNWPLVANK